MIGLALDAGSSKAGSTFSPLVTELNRLLLEGFRKEHLDIGLEIVLTLRVSGDIADFGFDGCDRLRMDRKRNRMTIDLGVPTSEWETASQDRIRSVIRNRVNEGVNLCLARLENESRDHRLRDLRRNVDHALSEFKS